MQHLNCRISPQHIRQCFTWHGIRKLTTQQQQQQQWYKPLMGQDSTGIQIYNCAAKRQVPLILPNEGYVSWYTCGPTVYDAMHLGHASCYVKLDIIQRILRQHFHLNLVTAMNITDIDDKIIRKSHEAGRDWREIAKYYEMEFWSNIRKLNVIEPNLKIRVTENMPKIIAFIESIMQKGCAYVGHDNSVYFDVRKLPTYGKLQRINIDDDSNKVELTNKKAAADFALWKVQKTEDEPSWPSPWGAGRPGWHIECSALASMIFGGTIDFHAGGLDLRFPHHENEEAQSCVFHNTKQWVNYWLHTGQLNVKGQTEKMSKSLKNTISVDDMLEKYTADEFRMACILSNYRNQVEYSDELMETSRNTLSKFVTFKADCQAYLSGKKQGQNLDANQIMTSLNFYKAEVDACLKNDFDTAGSVSVLIDQISGISRCINATNSSHTENVIASSCLDTVAVVDNFVQKTLNSFGFTFAEQSYVHGGGSVAQEIDLNSLLEDILQSRKVIRDRAVSLKSKELFQICDEMRNCLKQHGIDIRDHSQGSSWSFNSKLNQNRK